jgi:hypothetical protein
VTKAKYASVLLYAWLYAGWFACVFLGKWQDDAVSPIVPAIGWVLFWRALSPERRDAVKVFFLCVAGMLADVLFMKLGFVRYTPVPEMGLLPLWMVSLWLLFAPAIYIFTALFGKRFWLAALAGGVFGPLSYKSGESFGVLDMQGVSAMLAYAAFWAAFLPLAILWVRRPSP